MSFRHLLKCMLPWGIVELIRTSKQKALQQKALQQKAETPPPPPPPEIDFNRTGNAVWRGKQLELYDYHKGGDASVYYNTIYAAVKEGRKIVIYGKNEAAALFEKTLTAEAAYYVEDGSEINDEGVRNVYDLGFEKPFSFFVIVIKPECNAITIYETMTQLGLHEKKDYLMVVRSIHHEAALKNLRDPLLTWNRVSDEYENEYPGFKISGELDPKSLRIVTLGGSTTDSTLFGISSWPEHLSYMLAKSGIKAAVFNGGFSGYATDDELKKLLRDVVPNLNPHIVISYSGFNTYNTQADEKHYGYLMHSEEKRLYEWISKHTGEKVVYGIKHKMSVEEFQVSLWRMMYALCQEFGVNFLGILQPMTYSDHAPSSYLNEHIKTLADVRGKRWHHNLKNIKQFYDKLIPRISKMDYLRSYRHIFDGFNDCDIFCDHVHVYERGNQIIAAYIYEDLAKKGWIKPL